jgi:hypothetical protein
VVFIIINFELTVSDCAGCAAVLFVGKNDSLEVC